MNAFPKEKDSRSNTVIAVNVPENVNESSVREIMREKYKVLIAGGMGKLKGKIFRIGSMGTVSQTEVMTTVNALSDALKDVGYLVNIKKGLDAARATFQ
jgi:aspartate aminotransferase-like enzyme